MTYKGGGVTSPKCLSFIGNDYLIAAQKDSPIVNIWALRRKEQLQLKIICPGRIGALTVTPDGVYCIASIEEKVYIWQVTTNSF